jgi:hypothetical protein
LLIQFDYSIPLEDKKKIITTAQRRISIRQIIRDPFAITLRLGKLLDRFPLLLGPTSTTDSSSMDFLLVLSAYFWGRKKTEEKEKNDQNTSAYQTKPRARRKCGQKKKRKLKNGWVVDVDDAP